MFNSLPNRWLWLCVAWGCLGLRPPQHALYLSLQEIRYQAPVLTVGFRIFTDDLTDALRHHHGRAIPVADHWQAAPTQAAIMAYLRAKTRLSVDGQACALTLDHIEPQQDATWIACRVAWSAPLHRLHVHNRLLLDLFDTQQNLVRVYHHEEMTLTRLHQQQTDVTLDW